MHADTAFLIFHRLPYYTELQELQEINTVIFIYSLFDEVNDVMVKFAIR